MKRISILSLCALYAIIAGLTNTIIYLVLYPFVTYAGYIKKTFRHIVTALPQKYRELIQVYDINGLKHNIHYLNQMKHKIFDLPIEKKADFADYETINGIPFSSIMNLNYFENISEMYQHSNATSIGNLAYIILNTPDLELKSQAQTLLQSLTEYHNSFK